MRNPQTEHLVLHPALGLSRHHHLLQIKGGERQVELEWILKTHDGPAYCGLGRGIEPHRSADPNVRARIRTLSHWRWRWTCWKGRLPRLDLGGIEIGSGQHTYNCAGRCRDVIIGVISARACGAGIPCRGDGALLRRLRDGRIDVEGPSEPDDA